MSVPDQSIDPRLLSAAKEEFLKKGFEKASLAKICKAAGVTTGALYKRYKGKEELFCALVSDTVRDMMESEGTERKAGPEDDVQRTCHFSTKSRSKRLSLHIKC